MGSSQILVVDDNKMNRLLLARGLEQQGHRVSFAENGASGPGDDARQGF